MTRYPDPSHNDIKTKIAAFRKVQPNQIFLGVGSDEAIDILFRIFCNPREDNAVITPPTYGMYKVCAKVNDVEIKTAPLTPAFDADVPLILSTIDDKSKLLFLCSPGNPTSKTIPLEVIDDIASQFRRGIIVVDEAYIDFSSSESACSLIHKYPNLVVLQTLSKAFGLAGIRLGMAIANENIIQLMNNIKAPYNINKLTADVAKDALTNMNLFQSNVQTILNERKRLVQNLSSLSFVKTIHHSDANFILFVIPNAMLIYKIMADRGVVCRYR
jgi:histidinol-phosphate aminotransferase